MLAVNQTILLVMAEVVVAGLVGAGGLGLDVVTGFSRSEVGLGAAAGLVDGADGDRARPVEPVQSEPRPRRIIVKSRRPDQPRHQTEGT